MNLKRLFFSLVITLVIASSAFAANTIPEQIISDAKAMLKEISEQEDSSGMEDTLRGSYAVAIVPSMVKAGLLIGGTYGEGFILKRENGKWYGPSFYNIGGASFGLQAGAQEVALLMAVINERGVEAFLSSKTKLGGDVSIAAGPVGRRAEAALTRRPRPQSTATPSAKDCLPDSLWTAQLSASASNATKSTGAKVSPLPTLSRNQLQTNVLPPSRKCWMTSSRKLRR